MSTPISSVKSQPVPAAAPVQNKVGTDADGDNDGTTGKAAPAAPAFVAKPTATLGNNVDVQA